jgi:hypothetical protein
MSGFLVCPRCHRRGVSIQWLTPRIRRVRCRYCHQAREYDAHTWPGERAAVDALAASTYTVPPGTQARRQRPSTGCPGTDR